MSSIEDVGRKSTRGFGAHGQGSDRLNRAESATTADILYTRPSPICVMLSHPAMQGYPSSMLHLAMHNTHSDYGT